jgi:hypothetical protein
MTVDPKWLFKWINQSYQEKNVKCKNLPKFEKKFLLWNILTNFMLYVRGNLTDIFAVQMLKFIGSLYWLYKALNTHYEYKSTVHVHVKVWYCKMCILYIWQYIHILHWYSVCGAFQLREKKSYIYVKNFNTWQLCGLFFTFLWSFIISWILKMYLNTFKMWLLM